jgi:hypothetical protein
MMVPMPYKSKTRSTKRPNAASARRRRLASIRAVFSRPEHIGIAVIGAVIYYLLFYFLITQSDHGVFLLTIPAYMIYLLVITSGILLSISIFSIRSLRRSKIKNGAPASFLSVAMPAASGVIAGCSCEVPILGSILYPLGLNVFAVSGIISAIAVYGPALIAVFIAANLLSIYYLSGRIARTR